MAAEIGMIPLMILFVLLSALINMLMGSASAKWAIMAPIFIPMFMLMGYSPELSQVVYRIGDSVTNVISPMMSFFALIIAYVQKYDKNSGNRNHYCHHATIFCCILRGVGNIINGLAPFRIAIRARCWFRI